MAQDEFGILASSALLEDDCLCETCSDARTVTPENIEEMKMIQACWFELRQYIRIVYRLSMKGSLKSIDDDYQDYMKDIVSRLVEVCDPHQMFQRLEAQVKEFIIEIKVLLLQILDRMAEKPKLPHLFLTGLLDRYSKVMNAANVISPVLALLEEVHLHKFSLTWKLLNQRLFQSIIYSDVFFQNSVPLFLSQIGKMNSSDENKKLVKEFLKFDNELGIVEGLWIDIESSLTQYLQQRSTGVDKKTFLIHDWEEFKASKRQGDMDVLDNCMSSSLTASNGIDPDDLQNINIEEIDSEVLGETCECHVCLDASSHTPVDLIEQVMPLNSHRSGFHLYPHIHGTRGEFGPFLSEADIPDLCGSISDPQLWTRPVGKGLRVEGGGRPPHSHLPAPHHSHPTHPNQKRVDKATQKDPEVRDCEEKAKVQNRKTSPPAGHSTKESGSESNIHHAHCTKHSDIKRIPLSEQDDDGGLVDDSHSENSQSDPRHCDCCYCEVFGHGLPSAAPMSRNYQEMRERLRLLLNKKKSKCKSNSVPAQQHQPQQQQQPPQPQINHKKHQASGAPTAPPNTVRDTRALEDLLDFIEGNEVKCRNEKKAAKKARQKEKKILADQKKREEEERARLLEEQRKREEALAREAEERARLNQSKSKKKNSKGSSNSNSTSQSGVDKTTNPPKKPAGPQMVTIKRVMEPHNSEPTVTITLRGATPNQDRVLYTLLNGQACGFVTAWRFLGCLEVGYHSRGQWCSWQHALPHIRRSESHIPVCKVKDAPNDKKRSNSSKNNNNNGKTTVNNPPNVPKVKETSITSKPKGHPKKDKPIAVSSPVPPKAPQVLQVPVKELSNPSSIQINNAINNMTKKSPPAFNIADIKLPPGITITKVDPSTVQTRSSKIQENSNKKVTTAPQPRPPPTEVIMVATGKAKDTPVITRVNPAAMEIQNGKKKKNKKKNTGGLPLDPPNDKSPYPGLEIQPIKIINAEKDKDIVSRMSVLTISPYADNKVEKNETVNKKKKKKAKKTAASNVNHEEWKLLDSVFAPKDIDLDDGEMDDAERELEAFKRFCLQSIPPERKEKVHLNIKDIVLKKKSASLNY